VNKKITGTNEAQQTSTTETLRDTCCVVKYLYWDNTILCLNSQ